MSKPTVSAVGGAMPAEGHKSRRAALALFAGAPVLATLPVAAIAATSGAAVPPAEEIVTAAQMAAMNFEPWEHLEDGWKSPFERTVDAIRGMGAPDCSRRLVCNVQNEGRIGNRRARAR